ncbi:MAG: GDYXXLXY domain-containing protein [Siculibacillus sp.]
MKRVLHLLASVAVVGVLGWFVVDAEALIRDGEIVLVETAPVDPRSLIQGDYMRLAWAMERAAEIDEPGVHTIVIGLDERRVASFRRRADGAPLEADERLFQVRGGSSRGGFVIEPHSFLFQEGRADDFAGAKYGVFRVARSGRHLLTGLARADATPIAPR